MAPNPSLLLRANGKLLLSGEYAVLDGALALALPTRLGQALEVSEAPGAAGRLYWESLDERGETWFSAAFQTADWSCTEKAPSETARWIERLGRAIQAMRPGWLQGGTRPAGAYPTGFFPRLGAGQQRYFGISSGTMGRCGPLRIARRQFWGLRL